MTTKIYRLADEHALQYANFFGIELVEVTLADFSREELLMALIENHGAKWIPGEIPKEKTLADFNKKEIIYFLRDNGYTVWSESATKEERELSYKQGYEAGKRDAEPKWISILREAPPQLKLILLANNKNLFRGLGALTALGFQNVNGQEITHWLDVPPLPAPSEQEKPEAPKHTCAQCDKEITTACFGGDRLYKNFCSPECCEDYEWVDAEFPRDKFKEVRCRNALIEFFGVLIDDYVDDLFKLGAKSLQVYNYDSKSLAFVRPEYCQVRRDSVEGK